MLPVLLDDFPFPFPFPLCFCLEKMDLNGDEGGDLGGKMPIELRDVEATGFEVDSVTFDGAVFERVSGMTVPESICFVAADEDLTISGDLI